jgi:hypothetical protein
MPDVLHAAPRRRGASSLPVVMIRCSVARSVVCIGGWFSPVLA